VSAPDTNSLLIGHFVHRFVENDLLSAYGDRHEQLGLAIAAFVTTGFFAGVLLCMKYLLVPARPSEVAALMMEDRFVILAITMLVMALATAAQWNALSLDARDGAILGPLPIRTRQLVTAKGAALCIFGAVVAVSLTLAPSVLHPIGSTASLRLGLLPSLRLVMAHVLSALAGTMFAFVAILSLRELLRVLLGEQVFGRTAAIVQSTLVAILAAALLLVLAGAAGSAASLVDGRGGPTSQRVTLPVIWFLGLGEALSGDTVVSGGRSRSGIDDDLTRAFERRQPLFSARARTGLMLLGTFAFGGAGLYAWNSRRLPQPLNRRWSAGRTRDWLGRVVGGILVRSSMARAGFFFTVHVLSRSPPHRLAMAFAVALAMAVAVAVLGGSTPRSDEETRLSIWMLQTFALMTLAAGVRHALSLPAELRANWTFQHAWCGGLRSFITGVRCACLAAVMVPCLLVLLPLHVYLLGATAAALHAVAGLLVASVLLDLILLGREKPPFISSYMPEGRLKLAPIYLLGAAAVASSVAWLERAAAGAWPYALAFAAGSVALIAAVRAIDTRRGSAEPVALEDQDENTAQRLGLADHT
jgi:hypothetical protein